MKLNKEFRDQIKNRLRSGEPKKKINDEIKKYKDDLWLGLYWKLREREDVDQISAAQMRLEKLLFGKWRRLSQYEGLLTKKDILMPQVSKPRTLNEFRQFFVRNGIARNVLEADVQIKRLLSQKGVPHRHYFKIRLFPELKKKGKEKGERKYVITSFYDLFYLEEK